jgi:hypothetical protein
MFPNRDGRWIDRERAFVDVSQIHYWYDHTPPSFYLENTYLRAMKQEHPVSIGIRTLSFNRIPLRPGLDNSPAEPEIRLSKNPCGQTLTGNVPFPMILKSMFPGG